MNKNIVINKGDNKFTRKSKKALRAKIKRNGRKYIYPIVSTFERENEDSYLRSSVTYSHNIEEFCSVNRISRWKPSNNIIKLDEKFSLFEDPQLVLRTLLEMLHRAKISQQLTRLRYAGEVSFGALYLIDNLCWEIGQKRRWQILCENITETEKEKLSNLKSISSSTYENTHAYMINERVRINRSLDPKADQSYKVKSKEITDMVQQAIRETNNEPEFELSFNAYQAITSTIGEHFDNIVLHARKAELGILCGFYDKETKEITILIYNFGKTIYESLASDSLPDEMKDEIEDIIKSHSKRDFFVGKSKFTAENALTLLGLQEGISSRVKYDKSRGHGLMDFIEHCFNLNKETRIVLISGNTAIKIDKKYQIGKELLFGRERRVIAMNDANSIYEKPDSKYVINLNLNFPGVLIETTIPLKLIT